MKVPFIDLKAQYASIKEEINAAVQDVLQSCAFAGGPYVEQFEEQFADYCSCRYGIGVGSGTEALWLTLLALGIGKGDEVITVSNTFIATAEAISFCGATPVFVDIDEKTCNMAPHLIENAVTEKTKAVIPVHLYGQTADMDPITEAAQKHNLYIIEDACQAHGAEYKGNKAGSLGIAGCFSFYPGKNLGAYGEAGAVVTDDTGLAENIRFLRDHGQPQKYSHRMIGWNARMDGIQGAVLTVKLNHLDQWNALRRQNAVLYKHTLNTADGILLPEETDNRKHVYHLFPVRLRYRDELLSDLKAKDIHCAIHYPLPIHLQDAYKHLGLKAGAFPVTEKAAAEVLSLPMFPELTEPMIEQVCNEIKKWGEYGIQAALAK